MLVVFVALAIAAYCAPWVHSGGAATSLTGYDLAEWSSLVPGVRYGEQPMLVPGLLRAQLLFLSALVALIPLRRGSWFWLLCGVASLVLVVAQLPPFEYFLEESWRVDVNYGQQVTLALLALLDALVCWLMPRRLPRRVALLVLAAGGIITALAGASQALGLVARYDVPAVLGIGVLGYVASLIGVGAVALLPRR